MGNISSIRKSGEMINKSLNKKHEKFLLKYLNIWGKPLEKTWENLWENRGND